MRCISESYPRAQARQPLAACSSNAYGKFFEILAQVDSCLPKDAAGNFIADQEKSDVVHDLLARDPGLMAGVARALDAADHQPGADAAPELAELVLGRDAFAAMELLPFDAEGNYCAGNDEPAYDIPQFIAHTA